MTLSPRGTGPKNTSLKLKSLEAHTTMAGCGGGRQTRGASNTRPDGLDRPLQPALSRALLP